MVMMFNHSISKILIMVICGAVHIQENKRKQKQITSELEQMNDAEKCV